MSDNKIPSLSENSILRYFTFIILYFSQGIPEGITIFAIPAWMAMKWKCPIRYAMCHLIIITVFLFSGKEQQFIYFLL